MKYSLVSRNKGTLRFEVICSQSAFNFYPNDTLDENGYTVEGMDADTFQRGYVENPTREGKVVKFTIAKSPRSLTFAEDIHAMEFMKKLGK